MARTEPTTATAVDTGEVVPTSDPMLSAEKAHMSLIDSMRAYFKTEPREEIRILGDPKDGDVFVQVNGYTFLIQRNVKVGVPKSVKTLLEEGGYI